MPKPIEWREYVRRRLPHLRTRAERQNEIVEELALQLEAAYDSAIVDGATPDEARRRAESEVPDWTALATTLAQIEAVDYRQQADIRGAWAMGFVSDLRHAARSLIRTPSYSTVAILTLALALGLGTAAFSILDAVLFRPLPYAASDRLVVLKATVPPEHRETVEITLLDANDLGAETGVFEELVAVLPYAATTTISDPPTRIEGFEVSTGLFSLLGAHPALGRAFEPDDANTSKPPVAMISHAFWQRLGAPPDIVGQTLTLNEVPRAIIGVAPQHFRVELLPFPADVFIPLTNKHPFANRAVRAFRVIARLRQGVTREQATAAASTIGARLADTYPDTNQGRTFAVYPLRDEIVANVRAQLWLIAALVTLVLLVAAVNFAGLLLTRTLGRTREIAVRLALGAGRWRLTRESIAEGLLLAMAGGTAAAILAFAVLNAIKITPGLILPRLGEIALDWRSLSVLAILATVIACAVGMMPMAMLRRLQASGALRAGHETAGRPALRLRAALVVGQTCFAFVLLAAAVLLATSLRAVLAQPLGFETSQVITMRVSVPDGRYPTRAATASFYTELLDQLRAHPTVQAAGFVSTLPLAGNTGSALTIEGRENIPVAMRPTVGWQWASPGYFDAIGIPILRGRDFSPADATRTTHVTVINETLARLHFAGEDPIGKRVYFGGVGPKGPSEWHEVIGIVGDVRHRGLDAEPDARAYDLFGQHWGRTISLAVRSSGSPLQVAGIVRQLLAERDPRLAVFAIRTTSDLVTDAVAVRRMLLWLVTGFAFAGLAIALVGLYGTLSHIVTQRTREVGVRVALGATRAQISRLIVGRGLQMVVWGLGSGLLCAFALRRVIDAQLFGITTMNVPALATAAGALLATALVASLAPAARAMRVNPADALRAE